MSIYDVLIIGLFILGICCIGYINVQYWENSREQFDKDDTSDKSNSKDAR